MQNLYIFVLEISTGEIRQFSNEKIIPDEVNSFENFAFEMVYSDDQFFQLLVYTDNKYITTPLLTTYGNAGFRVGGKYDTPILLNIEDRSEKHLGTYVFVISQSIIDKSAMLDSIGIDPEKYLDGKELRTLEERCAHSMRISGFLELMNYLQRDTKYRKDTSFMVSHTKVYDEAFVSRRNLSKNTAVAFQENLTLLSAKNYAAHGKHTAVLNFANPVEPGGGILRGANAQEENICRSSNLYESLTSKEAAEYYKANNEILSMNQFNSMFLGTDRVVYSPDVLVLKENIGYKKGKRYSGSEQYVGNPFKIDVITCAAPFFSGSGYILPNGDLHHLYTRRIRNILEVAIDNNVDVLVLGAFGCGAFHNPANIVADAFRDVLSEKRYRTAFDLIVFAVKRTDLICPNIEAFERSFSLFPKINSQGKEKMHRSYWKWVCNCGKENSWDEIYCTNCNNSRKNIKCKVICYDSKNVIQGFLSI